MMISNTLPFFTPEPLFGELTYPFYRNMDKLTDLRIAVNKII